MEQQAFCNRCGAPMEGLRRCPRCGAPAASHPPPQPSSPGSTGDTRVPAEEWRQDPADWQQHLPREERHLHTDRHTDRHTDGHTDGRARPPEPGGWAPRPARGGRRTPPADRRVWPVVTVAAMITTASIAAGAAWLVPRGEGPPETGGVPVAVTDARAEAEIGTPVAGRPPGGPEGPGEAKAQARVLDALLADSGGSRSGLDAALEGLRSCEDAPGGLAALQRITASRREQVIQVNALGTGALDGGDAVRERLTRALTASFEADEAFLVWAARQSVGCDRDWSGDDDYRRGLAFSEEATTAKRGFLRLWNPLARRYGLPERDDHEI
ncbi:hypothetical protein ACLQ2R_12020 [Streptosporangium sp. DT93]|uniref:hypothetical protein n=1 Tax=Streptosporangium sp. DT93 TaxID=3393428 RepID=UPI003CE6ECB2